MNPREATSIGDKIHRAQLEIMDIKRRYFVVRAFLESLEFATRGKPFRVHNDIVWLLVLDARDMLVVHLASWCKGSYRAGGFFGQLRAHHLPDLRRGSDTPSGDPLLDALTHREHVAARARLFPGIQDRAGIRQEDLDDLKDRFEAHIAHVVADRDHHRAHPWERGDPGQTKMLDLNEIAEAFAFTEAMLNDLRLVATNSTMPSVELLFSSTEGVGDDLVDQILIGNLFQVREALRDRGRDEFYSALHRAHDARRKKGLFNESPFRDPSREMLSLP